MYAVYTLHDGNVWCYSWDYDDKSKALAQVERARQRGTRAICVKRRV